MSDPDLDAMRPASRGALFLPAFLGLAWPPTPGMEASAGRLHPALVHFPIALLLAAALFEGLSALRRRGPSPSARACLLLAALSAAIAAGSGWLYAEHDPPGRSVEELLDRHRWSGVATAACAWLALLLGALCRAPREGDASDARRGPLRSYRVALLVGAALVGFTGHLGGELVYGEGFVLEPLRAEASAAPPSAWVGVGDPAPDAAPDAPEGDGDAAPAGDDARAVDAPDDAATGDVVEFTADVQPLFEARCFECHGPRKQKGRLRLDVGAELFVGEPSGWAIVPGDAAASPVWDRIALPDWDPDRMPAEGPALTSDEIELVRRWIDGGALWNGVDVPAPRDASASGGGSGADGR